MTPHCFVRHVRRRAWRILSLAAVVLLSACASFSGGDLVPGVTHVTEVEKLMGPPALRWRAADGSQQLAYPRGPAGFHTYMVHIGADGRLLRIQNVLNDDGFAAIRPGMSQEDVLRVLGPSDPGDTAYFAARDELVWGWRYCDSWNEAARFYVLFDATSGKVRSTMSMTELMFPGVDGRISCGR